MQCYYFISSAVSYCINSLPLHKTPRELEPVKQNPISNYLTQNSLSMWMKKRERERAGDGGWSGWSGQNHRLIKAHKKTSFSNDVAKLQLVLGAFHPAVIDPTCRSGTQWLPCVAVTLLLPHWHIVHSISGLENYLHSLRGQESDVNKGNIWWGEVTYPVCSSYHSAWTQFLKSQYFGPQNYFQAERNFCNCVKNCVRRLCSTG